MSVDLFLGGPLGLWVLDNVDAVDVGVVYWSTEEIFGKARALGLSAWRSPALPVRTDSARGLSMHYPRLLPPEVLARYEAVYNVHPGYLPWGRCYYPVFWALYAGEPCGCTLHVIDKGIDTGPVVERRRVPVYGWDTGGTLHRRVSEMEKALFLEWWPRIAAGEDVPATPQEGRGSYHAMREFFQLKQRADTGKMGGAELLHLVRCLSHDKYTGLLVNVGGRMYEVSMRPVDG